MTEIKIIFPEGMIEGDLTRHQLAQSIQLLKRILHEQLQQEYHSFRQQAEALGVPLGALTGGVPETGSGGTPVFVHPHNPALVWSGRGRRPNWVREFFPSAAPSVSRRTGASGSGQTADDGAADEDAGPDETSPNTGTTPGEVPDVDDESETADENVSSEAPSDEAPSDEAPSDEAPSESDSTPKDVTPDTATDTATRGAANPAPAAETKTVANKSSATTTTATTTAAVEAPRRGGAQSRSSRPQSSERS